MAHGIGMAAAVAFRKPTFLHQLAVSGSWQLVSHPAVFSVCRVVHVILCNLAIFSWRMALVISCRPAAPLFVPCAIFFNH
jgi:hypothetical protein